MFIQSRIISALKATTYVPQACRPLSAL